VHLPHALLTLCGLLLGFEAALLGLGLRFDGAALDVFAQQADCERGRQLRVSVLGVFQGQVAGQRHQLCSRASSSAALQHPEGRAA
jgi:hypothetical protein